MSHRLFLDWDARLKMELEDIVNRVRVMNASRPSAVTYREYDSSHCTLAQIKCGAYSGIGEDEKRTLRKALDRIEPRIMELATERTREKKWKEIEGMRKVVDLISLGRYEEARALKADFYNLMGWLGALGTEDWLEKKEYSPALLGILGAAYREGYFGKTKAECVQE